MYQTEVSISIALKKKRRKGSGRNLKVNLMGKKSNVTNDRGFPGGSAVKNPPANAGDMGLIPGLGRFPGEGNGNPVRYSCLGNSMDRGDWWVTV